MIFLACWAWWAGNVAAAAEPPPVMFTVIEMATPDGYQESWIKGMNNKGDVVGRAYSNALGKRLPFYWGHDQKSGAPLPLKPPEPEGLALLRTIREELLALKELLE